jgi:hypothetical protein
MRCNRAPSPLVLGVVAAVGLLASPSTSGSEGTMPDVRSLVEGVYTLREWQTAQEVLRAPAIDGRFVLVDGVVVTALRNWSQPANKISGIGYGSYKLDGSTFSYSHEEATTATETLTEARVSHKPVFEGTRTFTVSREAGGVHFRRAEGGIEFFFTPEGLRYSENGKLLRVWQRVKAVPPS